ncbi:hypothetical protein PFICI_08607 [Pestalotiopsis fici W106-1]|uniref:Uncharacterized protein n=1 Tax=Pestalotiopsis fici (strain W106-1 / CGMCC3.15140) TaxID=1229662 RepID=W3WYB2_PESFW|nr:uncharacterized protein PFICI_08607 [Pestalotiopsis fici W106-1]ETS78754.1 hypothetical protein PFICI_08607 [Pestalotiopsis fici W106-1]
MKKSRLFYYSLLTGLATTGSLAHNIIDNRSNSGFQDAGDGLQVARTVLWEKVEYVVVAREATPRRNILERVVPEPTAALEGAAVVLRSPAPTAAPRKRQDDGQIQALSGQIQQLSISFSSASSASQSISQSAQQVQQSADQASRENSQALSRTQSSASSAVSQASQQANDRINQASSSMSSQISRNLASVQSSASSAVSVAQASASASMASAVNVAMSQLQAARAEATAVRSDANNFADQVQKNAISTTNLAIIVAVSVSGAVVLTSIIVCIFLRYRRRKREARDGASLRQDEKEYDKPIAVRGSVGGSRFNPFGSGSSARDKFKLPNFSPPSARKDEPLNFGFAMSDYSDLKEAPVIQEVPREKPAAFRLQKPPNVKSAEAVRVIRVNSKKGKEPMTADDADQSTDMPAPNPTEPNLQRSKSQVARKPVGTVVAAVAAASAPNSTPTPAPVPSATTDEWPSVMKETTKEPPASATRDSTRDTFMSENGARTRASSRYTMLLIASSEGPPKSARDSRRNTMAPQPIAESDEPGWRPPSNRTSRAASTKSVNTTAQRLAFRDSGDPIPEPDDTGFKQPRGGFSMASVSSLMRSDSYAAGGGLGPAGAAAMDGRQPTMPKLLPKGPRPGPSFAAFPTVRNGPPSGILNRPRPALVGKIREDAERRARDKQAQR